MALKNLFKLKNKYKMKYGFLDFAEIQ